MVKYVTKDLSAKLFFLSFKYRITPTNSTISSNGHNCSLSWNVPMKLSLKFPHLFSSSWLKESCTPLGDKIIWKMPLIFKNSCFRSKTIRGSCVSTSAKNAKTVDRRETNFLMYTINNIGKKLTRSVAAVAVSKWVIMPSIKANKGKNLSFFSSVR